MERKLIKQSKRKVVKWCLYVHVCHAQVGLLDMNFGGSGNQTTNVEEQA